MHFLDAAKAYVNDHGWPVFPVRERDKRPAVSGGFKAATLDLSQIESWAARNPSYNIGIPTGAASGFVILEFDFGKGGELSLEKLRTLYGDEFLDTFTVRSGSGGLHLYYRTPDWPFTNKVSLAGLAGVDTRGEGGYVVVPPSIHPNGNAYKVEKDTNPAKAPEWLRMLINPAPSAAPLVNKALEGTASSGKGRLSRATSDFLANGASSGEWNMRLFKAAKDFQEQGYTEEEAYPRFEGITGHLDEADRKTLASAFKKEPKHPPRAAWDGGVSYEGEADDAANLAQDFLTATGHVLREWQKSFYLYNGRCYVKKTNEDIKALILRWLSSTGRGAVRRGLVDDALLNLLGLCHVDSDTRPPAWLGTAAPLGQQIPMENGLVSVTALLKGEAIPQPHSPDYFNTICLPYPYRADATSEKWQTFLSEVVPDEEVRGLLQEWFGYNLIQDTSLERFVLMQGNGGDGKSVVCTVLRELVGFDNCSAVALEGFNVTRSYLLASTAGKLANIVEDVNHVEKTQEGVLKDFVSGGVITVEEKYKDPYMMHATARITFSCNNLPRFTDRSDGLKRRLMLIPFLKSVPKEKQDPRLKSPSYWRPELPGIFNWATEGLQRLMQRGRFSEPKAVVAATDAYALEMNQAKTFILDCYEMSDSTADAIPGQDIYNKYRMWSSANGQGTFGKITFNKELSKAFGKEITQEIRKVNGVAARVWVGLRVREASEIMEEVEDGTVIQLEQRTKQKKL
jgi:putative DNA primase/helicase